MDHEKGYADLFRDRRRDFEQLATECVHSLETLLANEGIKVHSVISRVKGEQSFLEKVQRKSYSDPLAQMPDLVGVRVVCIFLSDMPRVRELVKQSFTVHAEEDKVEGSSEDSFGYMSVHYECTLGDIFQGPRYDHLHGITFELQVRTILMDAWANVSHHLAYKGEGSIPEELRKDFHALSGLFYVADKHFELFFGEVKTVQQEVAVEIRNAVPYARPVDRDILREFLRKRYPDRKRSSLTDVSELAQDLIGQGYDTMGAVEDLTNRADDAQYAYEIDHPPAGGGEYADVGQVRGCLYLDDPSYRADPDMDSHYAKFREMIRPRTLGGT